MRSNLSCRSALQPWWPKGCCAALAALTLLGHAAVQAPRQPLQPTGVPRTALEPAGQVGAEPLQTSGDVLAEPLSAAGSTQAAPLWTPDSENTSLNASIARLKTLAARTPRRGSSAEKDSARAAWWLGLLALHGIGMGTDRAQAQRWFERARAMGERWASAGLAWCEIDGCRGPPSPSAARPWIGQLAGLDRGRSLYLEWLAAERLAPLQVASPTSLGKEAQEPVPATHALLLRAVQAGSVGAANELALQDIAAGRNADALTRLRAAAVRSPAAAANADLLASRMQTSGQTAPPSTPQAWFNDARRYHRGDGVPANYTEAIRLYQIAAASGSKPARRMLEMIYSRPAASGVVDIAWMQQLANLEISEERAVLAVLPTPSPRLFVRDPTPLYDLVPLQWRTAKEARRP